jgi:hypothetical protein
MTEVAAYKTGFQWKRSKKTFLQASCWPYLRTASMVAAATRLPVTARSPYMPNSRSVVFFMMVSLIAALLGTLLRLSPLLYRLPPTSPAQMLPCGQLCHHVVVSMTQIMICPRSLA